MIFHFWQPLFAYDLKITTLDFQLSVIISESLLQNKTIKRIILNDKTLNI